jgi:RNA polymerase-binding transcription factor DksA
MSGYGSPDDEALRAQIRVEERITLIRMALPLGHSRANCKACGEAIPQARQNILPGVAYCVACADDAVYTKTKYREPWAT